MKKNLPVKPASASGKISVVIADDHPLFRQGLRDVIAADKRFNVLGEAGDGERALELIVQLRPRIAVLDIDMPKLSGLQVAAETMRQKVGTDVIVLTMHEDVEHFEKAIELGVMGYVLKDTAAGDIVRCIESVLAGKNYVSATLSRHLMKRHDIARHGVDARLGISCLTPAERKILRLISQGQPTKKIADALYVSVKTVSAHRSNICVKLNLHGTNALLKFALEHKNEL